MFAERTGAASLGDLLTKARRVPSPTTWLVNGVAVAFVLMTREDGAEVTDPQILVTTIA